MNMEAVEIMNQIETKKVATGRASEFSTHFRNITKEIRNLFLRHFFENDLQMEKDKV